MTAKKQTKVPDLGSIKVVTMKMWSSMNACNLNPNNFKVKILLQTKREHCVLILPIFIYHLNFSSVKMGMMMSFVKSIIANNKGWILLRKHLPFYMNMAFTAYFDYPVICWIELYYHLLGDRDDTNNIRDFSSNKKVIRTGNKNRGDH